MESGLPLSSVRIVLSRPSHPGNIGAAARAMRTMGIGDLALVAPRHFPDPDATAMAAGAADLLARGESEKRIDQADYPQLRLTGNYGDVNPPFDAW